MKIGCFGKISQLREIKEAGFDCAELDICELVNMSESEYVRFLIEAKESGLGFEVFSGLLPLSIRIYEETFDEDCWMRHIALAAERVSELGTRMIPFGAGKCRSIPKEGMAAAKCKDKLLHFVRRICDILQPYGISLVIEPLGPANSNYINRISEASAFARQVNRVNCKIMCDMRHMVKNQEEMQQIERFADEIVHAHIDFPMGEERLFPQEKDGYNYMPYLEMLQSIGEDKILTIEATDYQDFSKESAESAVYLRRLLARRRDKSWPPILPGNDPRHRVTI